MYMYMYMYIYFIEHIFFQAVDIVNRRSFDRLTIISIEVLMLSIIHFPQVIFVLEFINSSN